MNNKIRHCGVIESINGNRAQVRTVRSSACDSCEAKAGCNTRHGKDFKIEVVDNRIASHKVGDRVYVEVAAKTGRQAVLIGFGLPLVVFVATLLGIHHAGSADTTAAMGAIGAIAIYYLIIYMLRRRVNRHFTIHLAD